jgi:hypothetical protein
MFNGSPRKFSIELNFYGEKSYMFGTEQLLSIKLALMFNIALAVFRSG